MKNVVERAVKTFVQAFLAAWLITGNALNKTALVAAVAAGVSAVWNSLSGYVKKTA